MHSGVKWVLASIAALILWGAWGVLLKLASAKAPWHQVYIATNTAIVVLVAIIAATKGTECFSQCESKWVLTALGAGFAGTLGYIFLVLALQLGGKPGAVIPLTSLYPAITAILSAALLHERINTMKAAGIILALAAIVLLTYEPS